jgi:RNA polymerase sigma-70 factor (ECF subfamily)
MASTGFPPPLDGSTDSADTRRPDETTQDLIAAAKEGDEAAWSELNLRYRRILAMFVRSSRPAGLQRRVGTEDMVQSTFISAYRGLSSYEDRGTGSFLVWLKAILRNRIAERLRQHQAERRDLRRDEPLESAGSTTAGRESSPSEIASKAELCSLLLSVVAELPSDQREIVMCHFFEDMPTKQIAQVLKASESSVRRRLASILGVLKHRLAEVQQVYGSEVQE